MKQYDKTYGLYGNKNVEPTTVHIGYRSPQNPEKNGLKHPTNDSRRLYRMLPNSSRV